MTWPESFGRAARAGFSQTFRFLARSQNGDAQNGDAQNGDAQNGDAQNGDTQNGDGQGVVVGDGKGRESGLRWLIMEKSGVKWGNDLKSGDLSVNWVEMGESIDVSWHP